jgi:hypothetical protein
MPGKANCCCPARMQHSVLLLAFVARTGARTCRCALERPTFCSLRLSGPEHVCIFGAKPCLFLILSTKTRLSAI